MEDIQWNDKAIELTAKAEVTCNPSDSLRWNQQFIPEQTDNGNWIDAEFNGVDSESDQGEMTLEAGDWRINQASGDYSASNTVSIYVNGSLHTLFNDPGLTQEFMLSIPYGETIIVSAVQTQGLFVGGIDVIQMRSYAMNGEKPQVRPMGDTVTVTVGVNGNTPNNGVLTLTPKVYNAEGAEVASGNSISLIVNVRNSGGGY